MLHVIENIREYIDSIALVRFPKRLRSDCY